MSTTSTSPSPRPFYGWTLVVLSAALATAFYGVWVTFSVFLKPLTQDFGWARGETALAYALAGVCAGVGGYFSGTLSDRFGTRPVVFFGGVSLGMGMILTGFITELWQLYLTYSVLLGGLGIGFMMVPVTSNIPLWFTKNKGLALGLSMAGTSLGIVVYPPIARYLIGAFGWRWAAIGVGLISWAIVLPAASFLRGHPRQEEIEPGSERDLTGARTDRSKKEAPRALPSTEGRPLGYVRGAMLCCCICHSIPLVHLVAYATDLGIGHMHAASILSLLGLSAVVGRIGMGFVSDRFGGMRTMILSSFLQSFTVLWLVFASEPWMFYAYAVTFGIGYGGIMPLYPVILKEVYGPDALASLFGRISIGGFLGMALGGYLGGLIFDLRGSYVPAFLFSFLVGSITFSVMIYTLWWTRREIHRGNVVLPDAPPEPTPV